MEVRRARTREELAAKMAAFSSPEGLDHAQRFEARPTDVVIAPDSKSGTTFLQQIAHGIRTGGSMDFEEISCVVPWTIAAHDLGLDLDAEQVAAPRLFKSHDGPEGVPQGARYIVAFREPIARVTSLYRFLGDWFFDTDAISLDEFALERITDSGSSAADSWHKLVAWWQRRDELDVLLLTYEDATADVGRTVDRVAAFLGIELDAQTREVVVKQASREFMLEHVEKFDDHLLRQSFVDRGVLPAGGTSNKVTTGTPTGLAVSDHVRELYAQAWRDHIEPATGLPDYATLRATLT